MSMLGVTDAQKYRFIHFLIDVENPTLWQKGAPLIHDSPEGGNPTLGFGHKVTDSEQLAGHVYGYFLEQLTVKDCMEILERDLIRTGITLTQSVEKEYDVWVPDLGLRERHALMDMEYNLGSVVKKFPKFTKAILDGDIETQRKEYKRWYRNRFGDKTELRRRNSMYFDMCLSPVAVKWYAKQESGDE